MMTHCGWIFQWFFELGLPEEYVPARYSPEHSFKGWDPFTIDHPADESVNKYNITLVIVHYLITSGANVAPKYMSCATKDRDTGSTFRAKWVVCEGSNKFSSLSIYYSGSSAVGTGTSMQKAPFSIIKA